MVKTSTAYDKAGFKATKTLVDHVRQSFGRSVPDSLAGEPSSLKSDTESIPSPRSRVGLAAQLLKRLG